MDGGGERRRGVHLRGAPRAGHRGVVPLLPRHHGMPADPYERGSCQHVACLSGVPTGAHRAWGSAGSPYAPGCDTCMLIHRSDDADVADIEEAVGQLQPRPPLHTVQPPYGVEEEVPGLQVAWRVQPRS